MALPHNFCPTFGEHFSDPAIDSQLKLIVNTLFVANDATKGFYVSDDVKVVLQQWNKNKLDTFFEDGVDSLEDIIDDLNERYDGKDYTYRVSAILENGMATTVVIYDNNNDYQRPETETPAGVPDASVSTSTMKVTVPVTTETKTSVADLAIAALEKEGYTVEGVKLNGSEYDLTASKGKVSGYEFTTDTVKYYKMNWTVDPVTYPGWVVTGPEYVSEDATDVTVSVKYTPGGVLVVDIAATNGLTADNDDGTAISSTPVNVKLGITTAPTANGEAEMQITIH